jgi:uncharacterized repeat protein (TIGR02543 family)
MKLSVRKVSVSLIFFGLIATLPITSLASAQSYYPLSQNRLTTYVNYPNAGYVTPSGSNAFYYGSIITARAYTYSGYVFDGWYLNGVYQGKLSTITLTMTQDYTLYAVFSQRTAVLTITSNPDQAGSTVPSNGIWNYSGGSSVTVAEYPAEGNTFSGWYLDGVYQGQGSTITVTMSSDHQLSAFFAGNGATTTPTPAPTPEPTLSPIMGLPVPSLTFYCASSASISGFNVQIQGALTYGGIGLSGTGVVLSYSVTGGATWHDLAYVITGDDGSFSAVWMPSASGNYLVKGVWYSDGVYSGVSNEVSFSVAPNPNQDQMFSVSSNSTLSSLTFDSTTSQLSFSVSGESGTTGYVQVCVPKTLLPDPNALRISLDGQSWTYHFFSQGPAWIITTEYHHSTHSVVMALASSTPLPTLSYDPTFNPSFDTSMPSTANSPELSALVTIPIIIVLLGLVIFLLLKRRKPAHS